MLIYSPTKKAKEYKPTTQKKEFTEIIHATDENHDKIESSLRENGFSLIKFLDTEDIPSRIEFCENILGKSRENFYGEVTQKIRKKEHTKINAFTNGHMPLHCDSASNSQSPNFIALHCLKATQEGGESTWVRVTDLVKIIKKENNLAQSCFDNDAITYYNDNRFETKSSKKPLFYFDKEGYICTNYTIYCSRVKFKNLDVKKAYLEITELSRDLGSLHVYKLSKNNSILFDNHRCLHGRLGFSGEREIIRTIHGNEN